MTTLTERFLNTGDDPRTLVDYAALRDEMNKLTHPARPDVNWQMAEKLCLSLFETNGVELQSAAWYTLVRTSLAGTYGLSEGLAILEALITHQWDCLWPQSVAVRMDILRGLGKRLQQVMRAQSLSSADLSPLYQAEKHLSEIGNVLQRLDLKYLADTEALRLQLHGAIVRLENSARQELPAKTHTTDAPVNLPFENPVILRDNDAPPEPVRRVYVALPEPDDATPPPPRPWKPFMAGMVTALVVCSLVAWGYRILNSHPEQDQLMASLAPPPAPLTAAQIQTLRQQSLPAESTMEQTRQQLTRLSQLPPDWNIRYGNQLIRQAQTLWPEQAKPLAAQWQRQLNAAALSGDSLNGWHQGMTQLQQLSDKLNALDERKGRYLTGSELKTMVYDITRSFNSAVPAEEQLRQLSQVAQGEPLPAALQSQAEIALKQLTARYALTRQQERSR